MRITSEFFFFFSIVSRIDLWSFRNGKSVILDGQSLSIAAVTAASRHNAAIELTSSSKTKEVVTKSRKIMADKVDAGISVYGVSTGEQDDTSLSHILICS